MRRHTVVQAEDPNAYAQYLLAELEAGAVDPVAAWDAVKTNYDIKWHVRDGAAQRIARHVLSWACRQRHEELARSMANHRLLVGNLGVDCITDAACWLADEPHNAAALLALLCAACCNWDAVCGAGLEPRVLDVVVSSFFGECKAAARLASIVLNTIPSTPLQFCAALDALLGQESCCPAQMQAVANVTSLYHTEAASALVGKLALKALSMRCIPSALFSQATVLVFLRNAGRTQELLAAVLSVIRERSKDDENNVFLPGVIELLPGIMLSMKPAAAGLDAVMAELSDIVLPSTTSKYPRHVELVSARIAATLSVMFPGAACLFVPKHKAFLAALTDLTWEENHLDSVACMASGLVALAEAIARGDVPSVASA